MLTIDPSINTFYTRSQEENRLSTGLGPLEFERNKILINRYLNDSYSIADIGGGPGHYAKWLADLGHRVTLIDPVKKHINQAKQRSAQPGKPFQCLQAEARHLPLPDKSQNLVILHGPLYHLQQQVDRIAALQEARRVLKSNGVLLGFAITHSASLIASLQSNLIHHPGISAMCKAELLTGVHQPPPGFPGMLPAAFYHRPSVLTSEFEHAGFFPLDLLPVEGIAWLDGRFFESWADQGKRQHLLELVEMTEKDNDLLCFSPHILLAAQIKTN
ncbi:class I SAM-dependent methyltransferase [Pedobacter chinensis]|uniref:Class I SAM-dependent methyltransferase n=1 Tax=Pedobacter chinensis TaxID=2282421 RepID=A0A369Q1U3_9SPHI|nr:class I SAM-dependent methyltransferase [Pedobacter chinensis]RDC57217.1 class I SAM-dependent methyltransferase [Pedobacter chinensis]